VGTHPIAAAKEAPLLTSLAPRYKEEWHGTYLAILKRAIEAQPEVHNIALSGAYGLGKTSVLDKLAEDLGPRVVKLSLLTLGATPEPVTSGDANPAASTKTNRIQKELVKQLLYQMHPSEAPHSRFRRISAPKWGRELCAALIAAVGGIALSLLLDWAGVSTFGLAPSASAPVPHAVIVALAIGVVAGCLALVARMTLRGQITVDKLTAGPATLTLSPRSSTYFDEYLDEIIYFFEVKKKIDIVIIEDLDRFDDPGIFESLRGLNGTLNAATQIGRNIRFVYAMRDSVFEKLGRDELPLEPDEARAELVRANRTKFFELVVPMVPFISHKNARDLLNGLLAMHPEIPRELVDIAARHVADMRLLHNVVNEYEVFSQQLISSDAPVPGLEPPNLFAMVLFKNSHLADFEKIRLGRSSLDALYDRWRTLISENSTYLRDENLRIREGINRSLGAKRSAEELGMRLRALLDTLAQGSDSPLRGFGLSAGTDQLVDPDYWRDLSTGQTALILTWRDAYGSSRQTKLTASAVEHLTGMRVDPVDWEKRSVDSDRRELTRNESDLAFLRHHTWQELSDRPDLSSPPSSGSQDSFSAWVGRLLPSRLAVDLVLHGYINSYYSLHVSSFYGQLISPQAMNFILHSIDRGTPDIEYPLEALDVEAILRDQGRSVLAERSMYNTSVLDYLLAQDPEGAQVVSRNLAEGGADERRAIGAYLGEGTQPLELMRRLAPHWRAIFTYLAGSAPISEDQRTTLMEVAITHRDPHLSYEIDDEVRHTIEASYQEYLSLRDPDLASEAESVIRFFEDAAVTIASVTGLSAAAQARIAATRVYSISAENLEALTTFGRISLDELAQDLPEAYEYSLDRPTEYLEAVAMSTTTGHTIADPAEFVGILNRCESWPPEAVTKLITGATPECVVEDIQSVPDSIWRTLVSEGRVWASFSNVFAYFGVSETIDAELTALLAQQTIITGAQEYEQDDRADLAVAIINSGPACGEPQHRVDLALSIDPGQLDAASINPEAGELVGRMIDSGLLADDAGTFTPRLLKDWPSYESAVTSSTKYATFVGPDVLPTNYVERLFASTRVDAGVKASVTSALGEFAEVSRAAYQAVADSALRGEVVLNATGIEMVLDGGATVPTIVELLAMAETGVSTEDLRRILRKLPDPYSTIADPGVKRPTLVNGSAQQRLLARLKEAGIVSNFWVEKQHLLRVTLRRP